MKRPGLSELRHLRILRLDGVHRSAIRRAGLDGEPPDVVVKDRLDWEKCVWMG